MIRIVARNTIRTLEEQHTYQVSQHFTGLKCQDKRIIFFTRRSGQNDCFLNTAPVALP